MRQAPGEGALAPSGSPTGPEHGRSGRDCGRWDGAGRNRPAAPSFRQVRLRAAAQVTGGKCLAFRRGRAGHHHGVASVFADDSGACAGCELLRRCLVRVVEVPAGEIRSGIERHHGLPRPACRMNVQPYWCGHRWPKDRSPQKFRRPDRLGASSAAHRPIRPGVMHRVPTMFSPVARGPVVSRHGRNVVVSRAAHGNRPDD